MNWMNLFENHILKRGMMYCEDGKVIDFEVLENRIEAEVAGSDYYHVSIDLDGEDIIDMTCDCPYAAKGYNCKHMAAVLCEYEGYLAGNEDEEENAISPMYTLRQEVEALVDKIPEQDAKELLVHFLINDDGLKNRLQLKYDFKMTAQLMAELKKEIKSILYQYSGRGGFIDWNNAYSFCCDLGRFLDDKIPFLMEHGCYLQAFELVNIVFYEVANADMDDSDGGSGMVAQTCYDYWKSLTLNAPEEEALAIKKWFLVNKETDYVVDYMQEYIDEFYEQFFLSEDEIKERMEILDDIIQEHKMQNDAGAIYSVRYGYQDVVLLRLEYMRQLHLSDEEILEFRTQHRHFSSVRELELEEALEANNKPLALQILEESKRLDKDCAKKVKRYSEQLISLYEELRDEDKYTKELIFQLLHCYQTDLTYYNKLKKCIGSKTEWNKFIDSILEASNNIYFICDILAQENKYEKLMKIVEEKNNVALLDEYEKQMRKEFPERVIRVYANYIIHEMERASSRGRYRELVQYLRKLAKCENGKSEADRIVQKWRVEYKRRTALMDELRKVGY
ncbi:MAG: SWIM zinc finger family protein [Lachnospiraceae bacterium]|nr:SWIM zinc finger family protein [Lachnospiraceae bacterium]